MKKIGSTLALGASVAVFIFSSSQAFAAPPEHANGKAFGIDNKSKDSVSAGTGANTAGPYDPYGVGAPSGNGNGDGNANGKPCAGCVGNADSKNPPGQLPGPQDNNRGYECDENSGIGKTNPAHSGCAPSPTTTTTTTSTTLPPTTTTTAPPPTTTTVVITTSTTKPSGSLPRTGGDIMPLLGMGISATGIGGALSMLTRRKS